MSPLDVADNTVAVGTKNPSLAYVPPLQRTKGQPPPIAANGALLHVVRPKRRRRHRGGFKDALAKIASGDDNAQPR